MRRNYRCRNGQFDSRLFTRVSPLQPSNPRGVLRVTGFGPLITDGLGVIHTYITGLLFRPPTNDTDFFLTLPPIHGHSAAMPNGLAEPGLYGRSRKTSSSSFDDMSSELCRASPFPLASVIDDPVYPKREKCVREFK